MALYPNVRRDIIGVMPTNIYGYLTMRFLGASPQKNTAYFGNSGIAQTSSIPEGTFESPVNILPPLVGGGMSASDSVVSITMSMTGNMLNGGAMLGEGDLLLSMTGSLSLTVSASGTTTITVTGDSSNLALTIGLGGTGSWSITGDTSQLALLVPLSGSGVATLTGDADLKGLLSLSGESTPFTELSPQNLAEAVWGFLSEGAFTTGDLLRLIAAVNCGKVSGGPTSPVFRDVNDTTDRVSGTADANGNRSSVTLNPD